MAGGALLAKYSYKKLSQNEAEFIPDECLEYQTPIIKTRRSRSEWRDDGARDETVAGENTDDDIETESSETNRLLADCSVMSSMSSAAGADTSYSVSSMSCSESTTTACFSDSATQYCSRDTDTEDMLPDYDFSVHYPVSLREEDCDWGESQIRLDGGSLIFHLLRILVIFILFSFVRFCLGAGSRGTQFAIP